MILEITFDDDDFSLLYSSGAAGDWNAFQDRNGTGWRACYTMHTMADAILARAFVEGQTYACTIERDPGGDILFYTDYDNFRYKSLRKSG